MWRPVGRHITAIEATGLGRQRLSGLARGSDRPFSLFRQAHQSAQRVASARQAGAGGADRTLRMFAAVFVRHSFKPDEQDHLALLPRQAGERLIEFAKLARCGRSVTATSEDDIWSMSMVASCASRAAPC